VGKNNGWLEQQRHCPRPQGALKQDDGQQDDWQLGWESWVMALLPSDNGQNNDN
jgi:hypothetical protein